MNIFDCKNYREFVTQKISENEVGRGYKAELAAAAGCQRSFFSQVIGGKMDLSREQAADLARFFGFDPEEEEYFVLLVDLARTSSKRLLALIERRLHELKSRRVQPTARIHESSLQDLRHQTDYYSSWFWSAIHLLTSISEFQTPVAISRRLKVPLGLTQQILMSLQAMGLVDLNQGKWIATKKLIHLPASSSLNEINHTHWRFRAVADVQRGQTDSIHYSSVCAFSKEDFEKLKQLLANHLMAEREVIMGSPEEELYCLNHDLFRI